MTLLSALAPSMMNRRQTLGSSPRSIRLSMSGCTTAAFSVAPSIRASGCLWPSPSMPTGGDQHQLIADVQHEGVVLVVEIARDEGVYKWLDKKWMVSFTRLFCPRE